MINDYKANRYCREDISLIENYNEAINSDEMWDCHHRLETDLGLSQQELINTNRYWNVEAKYLIFLTQHEHRVLHTKNKPKSEEHKHKLSESLKGRQSPMKGKQHSTETKQKMSEANKGENNPMYRKQSPMKGKHLSEESKQKMSEARKLYWSQRRQKTNALL